MIKAHISYSIYSDKIEIFLVEKAKSERVPLKITVEKQKPAPAGFHIEPSLVLDKEEFQEIASALYSAVSESGLFTIKEDATTSELKATKYHLEDMRALVFEERENTHNVGVKNEP